MDQTAEYYFKVLVHLYRTPVKVTQHHLPVPAAHTSGKPGRPGPPQAFHQSGDPKSPMPSPPAVQHRQDRPDRH